MNSDGFSAYLGDDPYDGDNSDNGEYVLHTANAGWVLTHGDDIVASWGFRAKKSEAGKTLTAIAEGSALGPGFGPCPRDDWEMERRERDAHYDPPDGWKRPVVTPPPDLEPEALQVAVFCAVADAVKAAGGHDLSLRFMCRSNSCQTDAERVAVAREWADLAGWPGVEA